MASIPVIKVTTDKKWSNWHNTLHVGGKTKKTFQPLNEYESGAPPQGREFVAGLAGLQKIIVEAQSAKARVRAHGSGWSLNNIAFVNEFFVNSNSLDYVKVGLDQDQVTDAYKSKANLLTFAQCGLMVKQLNIAIQAKKLALPTSGASDGQRIVGAISTGTHGSAHAVGAMTEYVRGIHAVVLGKHVFLQRSTNKVVNDKFAEWLDGAEIINDDDLFNAALVGFGGFGLIHALLLEVEPQYYLERVIQNYHISEVRKAITSWDFSDLNLPEGNKMPFHFECVINPYPIPDTEKGAFVRVYYRHDSLDDSSPETTTISDTPDLHRGVGTHFDDAKGEEYDKIKKSGTRAEWIGFLMQIALKFSFPTKTPDNPTRIPGKWFTGTDSADPKTKSPIPATSLELGIPFDRIGDAMDLILETVNKDPFAAPMAFRYVKRSTATLGFTGIADTTVTIEMPGPFGRLFFNKTGAAHKTLFKALRDSNIPHSFHWGQQFPKNTTWAPKVYGQTAVDSWKAQRLKLLGAEGAKMFSNDLMEDIGLYPMSMKNKLSKLFMRILKTIIFWKS